MEKITSLLTSLLGLVIFCLLLYGLYNLAIWIFDSLREFSPKTLAIISLALIVLPIALTLALATQSNDAYTSGPAGYAIMLLPVGILGLVISGIWFLLAKIF